MLEELMMASTDDVGRGHLETVNELPQERNADHTFLRVATDADIPAIYSIHTSSIRERCSTHYTSDEIAAWVERQSPHKYLPFVQQQCVFVAEEQGEVVGFAHLGQGEEGSGEVKALYVAPSATRRGIGSRLLCLLEHQAACCKGWGSLVVKSTVNAVDFYTSQGFAVVGNTQHTVGNQSLECVLLRKELLLHT